jgi:hypothetical protein
MSHFVTSTSIVTDIAISVPNLTGGDNGKVVRISGTNQVANASQTDTTSQLNTVLIKMNDVYYAVGVVPGYTALNPGSSYFLGVNGVITPTPPTPSSSVRVLYIGFAINTTELFLRPGIPISGA